MEYFGIYFKASAMDLGEDYPVTISKDKTLLEGQIKNKKDFYIERLTSLPVPEKTYAEGKWYISIVPNTFIFDDKNRSKLKEISRKDLSKLLSKS